MRQKLNQKGFSLVEIVVVLLIVSIVMALAGTMILSSFNLFGQSTQEDVSKRALDKVGEYVKNELIYASDIRVSNTKPDGDNWSYLDVANGHLVQNDNAADVSKEYNVYSSSYYNSNTLDIVVSNFVESNQFDLNYTFFKSENQAYEVVNTLKFPNLTLKAEKDLDYKPFDGLEGQYALSNNNVRIYYVRGSEQTIVDPKPTITTGTVADQIDFLNNYNNREVWIPNAKYRRGDMVFVDGFWWYCLVDDLGKSPTLGDQYIAWKKIDGYYDSKSGYQRGDIIIYKGNYYRCKQDIIRNYNPTPDSSPTVWEKLVDLGDKTVEDILKGTIYTNNFPIKVETVRNKLDTVKNIKEFNPNRNYNVGEVVKIYRPGFEGDDDLASYFECVVEHTKSNPTSGDNYDWKYLSIEFNQKSAYNVEDVVFYTWQDGVYIKTERDVRKPTIPHDEFYGSSTSEIHWTLIKIID